MILSSNKLARSLRVAARIQPWTNLPALFVLGLVLVAIWLYRLVAPFHSFDADHWFVPWLDQMLIEGPWHALGTPMQITTDGASGFANYNPPYLYLLALGSHLSPWLDMLQIVKVVSVAGTLACAACLFVLLRELIPRERAMIASAAFLLLPTVVLNGAFWGQTDAIYSGLIALVVAAAIAERPAMMLVAFGAALAVKLPALFLGPFLLHVALSRGIPARLLLLMPLAYGGALLPAWLAGRSMHDLTLVYFEQSETYHWLSMKAPNPWALIQYLRLIPYEQGVIIGVGAASIMGIGLTGLAFHRRLEGADLLLLALAVVTLMPYLLPKMHDRYFFPADVLGFAYAAVRLRPRPVLIAAFIEIGSLSAYGAILFNVRSGPIVGAAFSTVALWLIVSELFERMNSIQRASRTILSPLARLQTRTRHR